MIQFERSNRKEVVQICVGYFVGALTFSVEGGILDIGDGIPFTKIILIMIASIIFSYSVSYLFGVRKLDKHRIRLIAGFIPKRTLIHYISALFFSLFVLWLFGAGFEISYFGFLKRMITLSLPATVGQGARLICWIVKNGVNDFSRSSYLLLTQEGMILTEV